MQQELIKIKNLNFGYGKQKVLQDVCLTVKSDDFIGIIGPNGGGKTTLVKAVLGLVPVLKGTVSLNLPSSKIGYLPQFTSFDKDFPITVTDVVLSGLAGKKGLFGRYKKEDKLQASKLIYLAGIGDLKHKAIGQLSGGQTQRALLCRALINKPELLILDEPGTFVDSNFEKELFDWLKELNKKMAIIMVSHDLGMVSSHVKTIACVNKQLHYHKSNKITNEQLALYNCPIQIVTHGRVPHQVLANHKTLN